MRAGPDAAPVPVPRPRSRPAAARRLIRRRSAGRRVGPGHAAVPPGQRRSSGLIPFRRQRAMRRGSRDPRRSSRLKRGACCVARRNPAPALPAAPGSGRPVAPPSSVTRSRSRPPCRKNRHRAPPRRIRPAAVVFVLLLPGAGRSPARARAPGSGFVAAPGSRTRAIRHSAMFGSVRIPRSHAREEPPRDRRLRLLVARNRPRTRSGSRGGLPAAGGVAARSPRGAVRTSRRGAARRRLDRQSTAPDSARPNRGPNPQHRSSERRPPPSDLSSLSL